MWKFIIYVGRWQLSTPILWVVVSRLGTGLEATVIANLIGASIFFWVDKFIFRTRIHVTWEVMRDSICNDCGTPASVRRLVLAPGGSRGTATYDRREDPSPQYRCQTCSEVKLRALKDAQMIGAVSSATVT